MTPEQEIKLIADVAIITTRTEYFHDIQKDVEKNTRFRLFINKFTASCIVMYGCFLGYLRLK